MFISIRPNLNHKNHITLHKGTMGTKLDSVSQVTIDCVSVTVRPSGCVKALNGDKTVHASLNGKLAPFEPVTSTACPITYNPHKGDTGFYVEREDGSRIPYEGGGVVTMIGWHAWLIK